ncbi:MAG: helix-turn-helix transcriptional regulator [Oscillospiraceae bacterium]|nr:helix-turn-helix transcriptional regulator [Oscillospiraceae bacterium]
MSSRPSVNSSVGGMLSRIPVLVEVMDRKNCLDPSHWHNYTQIWYVLRGTLLHNIDGEFHEQPPGGCAVVLPYTMHSVDARDDGEGVYMLSISYEDTFLSNRGYSIFSYFKERAFFDGFKIPLYTVFSPSDKERADAIAHGMIEEFGRHKEMCFDKLSDFLADLLHIVCTEPTGDSKGLEVVTDRAHMITKTISYMSANISKKFTLDELCAHACMSRCAFTKNFKLVTGMTSKEFLVSARIHRAGLLLTYTDKSLPEIAADVGFYDNAYLSRVFSEHYGVTPMTYREKNRVTAYAQDEIYRKRWAWYFDDNDPYTNGLLYSSPPQKIQSLSTFRKKEG